MIKQCVFCYCDIKPEHYNTDICEHCLREPLPSGAFELLQTFYQCSDCDKMLCPFHVDQETLESNLCEECSESKHSHGMHGESIFRFTETPCYLFAENNDEDCNDYNEYNNQNGEDSEDAEDSEDGDYGDDGNNNDEDEDDDEDEDEQEDEENNGGFRDNAHEMEIDDAEDYVKYLRRPVGAREQLNAIASVCHPIQSHAFESLKQQEKTCPICLDILVSESGAMADMVHLPCHDTHIFHASCINEWLVARTEGKSSCPLCCQNVFRPSLAPPIK